MCMYFYLLDFRIKITFLLILPLNFDGAILWMLLNTDNLVYIMHDFTPDCECSCCLCSSGTYLE